jgi:hypothetical protein
MSLLSLSFPTFSQPAQQIEPLVQSLDPAPLEEPQDESQALDCLHRLHQQHQFQTQQRLQADYSLERRTFL